MTQAPGVENSVPGIYQRKPFVQKNRNMYNTLNPPNVNVLKIRKRICGKKVKRSHRKIGNREDCYLLFPLSLQVYVLPSIFMQ